jgi:hypothetical protein
MQGRSPATKPGNILLTARIAIQHPSFASAPEFRFGSTRSFSLRFAALKRTNFPSFASQFRFGSASFFSLRLRELTYGQSSSLKELFIFLKFLKKKSSEELRTLRKLRYYFLFYITELFYNSSGISPSMPAPGPPLPPAVGDAAITSSILRIIVAASVAALIAWVFILRGSSTLFSNISSTLPV